MADYKISRWIDIAGKDDPVLFLHKFSTSTSGDGWNEPVIEELDYEEYWIDGKQVEREDLPPEFTDEFLAELVDDAERCDYDSFEPPLEYLTGERT